MPITPTPVRPSEFSNTACRWLTMIFAVMTLVFLPAYQHSGGRPWPSALLAGLGAALSGTVLWSTYRWVSRRNNGAISFALGVMPFNDPRRTIDTAAILTGLIVALLLGALIGGWTRWLDGRRVRRRSRVEARPIPHLKGRS